MIDRFGFAMSLQFRHDGAGGWVYRRDQIGPALPVTAAERARYVRWYGWITLSAVPLLMGMVFVFALIANAFLPNPTNNQRAVVAIGGMTIVGALLYLYLRWFSHAPARTFADRTPVAPARTRKEVFGRRLGRFSYGRLALTIVGLIALGLFALRETPEAWWLPFVLFLPIGAGFVWWKWRIETS